MAKRKVEFIIDSDASLSEKRVLEWLNSLPIDKNNRAIGLKKNLVQLLNESLLSAEAKGELVAREPNQNEIDGAEISRVESGGPRSKEGDISPEEGLSNNEVVSGNFSTLKESSEQKAYLSQENGEATLPREKDSSLDTEKASHDKFTSAMKSLNF